jgi:hypothetical protein
MKQSFIQFYTSFEFYIDSTSVFLVAFRFLLTEQLSFYLALAFLLCNTSNNHPDFPLKLCFLFK